MQRLCLYLLLGLFAGACASGAPLAKDSSGVATADAVSKQLDEAELSLHAALLREQPDAKGEGEDDPRTVEEAARPFGAAEADRVPTSRCARACRALASMSRSAAQLCELTGESDGRCQSARARLEAAERLIREICGGCSP